MDRAWMDQSEETLLLVPGPTPVPGHVLRAQARAMMNHRAPAFRALLRAVTEGLKPCFGTSTEPLTLTSSGTGGLEAAVVNALSPGDRVLSVLTGQFGKRFAEIAEAYGAQVDRLNVDWGQAVEPEAVRQHLAGHGPYKAVLTTLNETSTGVVTRSRNWPASFASMARYASSTQSAVSLRRRWRSMRGASTSPWPARRNVHDSPGAGLRDPERRRLEVLRERPQPRFYFDLKAAADPLPKARIPGRRPSR